jgi:hypothetical protein
LGALAALGYCQPDGTFITALTDLRQPSPEPAAGRQAVRRRAGSIRRMDRPLATQTALGVTASEPASGS